MTVIFLLKNVQVGLRRFKQIEEGSIIKGAIGFQKVLKGSRRFKNVQEDSRIEKGFKKVLDIKRRFKMNVQESQRTKDSKRFNCELILALVG